jgi:hypothetical protein
MMVKALIKGFWRVVTSPGLIVWLWLVNFLVALPLVWMMTDSIRSSIGASLVGEKLTQSFDMEWYGEYEAEAKGIETTFTPTVVGAGAFYNNLEAWLSGDLFDMIPVLVGLGVVFILTWALFLGGVLERYSGSGGLFNLGRFFAAGGKFFFRFVRLAVFSGVLYYAIYRLADWLFEQVELATIDVTVERTVFLYTVLAALLVAFLLTLVNMCFDYAKIITFKEDRRSMLIAAWRGIGFVFSHPLRTVGLYYALIVLGAVLLGFYASIAPGANQSTTTGVVLAFLVGQLALVVKLMLRLWFYAGQMSLYEAVKAAPSDSNQSSVNSNQ